MKIARDRAVAFYSGQSRSTEFCCVLPSSADLSRVLSCSVGLQHVATPSRSQCPVVPSTTRQCDRKRPCADRSPSRAMWNRLVPRSALEDQLSPSVQVEVGSRGMHGVRRHSSSTVDPLPKGVAFRMPVFGCGRSRTRPRKTMAVTTPVRDVRFACASRPPSEGGSLGKSGGADRARVAGEGNSRLVLVVGARETCLEERKLRRVRPSTSPCLVLVTRSRRRSAPPGTSSRSRR